MGRDIRETTVSFDTDRKLIQSELDDVVKYCVHDVNKTVAVFTERIKEFTSHVSLITEFRLNMKHVSKTKAQLSSMILNAHKLKLKRHDEMDYVLPATYNINKYLEVVNFYQTTIDIYAHVTDKQRDNLADKFAKYIGGLD